MTAYEAISHHTGKTIVAIYEHNGDIVIRFNDNSHMILKDRGCNTCGGYIVEGMEDD